MPKAVLYGRVLAESGDTVVVEGNHYFPPDSVRWDRLDASRTRTLCPWKGIASYHHAVIDDLVVHDAAWTYRRPLPFARRIRGYVAFTPLVEIEPSELDHEHAARRSGIGWRRRHAAS